MELLSYLSQLCSALTASTSPSIDAIGVHLVLGLATILMVWFGLQEAVSSAQGGPGFNLSKFLNFVMLVSFAWAFVNYYNTTIPGVGYSLQGWITAGTDSIVDLISTDSTQQMLSNINGALQKSGSGIAFLTTPYLVFAYLFIQLFLAILSAVTVIVIAYGAIGGVVIGLLGPLFIPWMIFDKTEWLFWTWLKAFLNFAFYKVVAAAVLFLVSRVYMQFYVQTIDFSNPIVMIQSLPILVVLMTVLIFTLIKIPALAATLFSGSAGGHDAGMGLITAFALKG